MKEFIVLWNHLNIWYSYLKNVKKDTYINKSPMVWNTSIRNVKMILWNMIYQYIITNKYLKIMQGHGLDNKYEHQITWLSWADFK